MCLAVGPFEAVADERRAGVTHFCPPPLRGRLEGTVKFFGAPFDLYEEYLETDFPYASFQQVGYDWEYAPWTRETTGKPAFTGTFPQTFRSNQSCSRLIKLYKLNYNL
eukprot:1195765-Prorocentrum_minimum.AAC.9